MKRKYALVIYVLLFVFSMNAWVQNGAEISLFTAGTCFGFILVWILEWRTE